jgi:hypothetical protein
MGVTARVKTHPFAFVSCPYVIWLCWTKNQASAKSAHHFG